MDTEFIAHFSRIERVCKGLIGANFAISNNEIQKIFDTLSVFDDEYYTFVKYLSLPFYQETAALLENRPSFEVIPPRIAVIIPVFNPDETLLRLAVNSAINQIGVKTHLLISLDGSEGNRSLVERVLKDANTGDAEITVLSGETNEGVGLCRNRALRYVTEDWFTFLDSDDIFHPLRCLHACLALAELGVKRLNTGYCRVSLREKKIVLLQDRLSAVGGSSFMASREILKTHGYLAPLRFYEDTEYENRLRFFQLPMAGCEAVGHYQNTDLSPTCRSLSTRWRREIHLIKDHPYLYGTVRSEIDEETLRIKEDHEKIYNSCNLAQIAEIFNGGPGYS